MGNLFDFINANIKLWLEPQDEELVLMLGINPELGPPQSLQLPIAGALVRFDYVETVKSQAIYRATKYPHHHDPKHSPVPLTLGVQVMLHLMF